MDLKKKLESVADNFSEWFQSKSEYIGSLFSFIFKIGIPIAIFLLLNHYAGIYGGERVMELCLGFGLALCVIAFFGFLALVILTGIVYIFMLIIKIFDVNDHLPNFDPHHPFN